MKLVFKEKFNYIEEMNHKSKVPAVEQGCKLLLFLGESPEVKSRLTEIAKQLGIHKSRAYYILKVFENFGLVEKDPTQKTYQLGVGLLFLARRVLDNLNYPAIVNPFLKKLVEETEGIALFGFLRDQYLYIIAKYEPPQNLGFTLRLGHRFHFTYGAHGKAIVAFLPEVERKKVLREKPLYFYGDKKPLNIKYLENELSTCRKKGFAVDFGEIQAGINAISSPVFDFRGKIVGCIILVGTFQKRKLEEYGYKTLSIAMKVSREFGADVENQYRLSDHRK